MADVILKVTMLDLNIATAVTNFLKIKPNDERVVKDGIDPNDIPENIPESDDNYYQDAFATTKLWAEEVLTRHLWNILEKGHKQILRETDVSIGNRTDWLTSGD